MNLVEFEKSAGLSFKNKLLLQQAFTHRSYINENRSLRLSHNERLEFLGDAVLELVITKYLFDNFPAKNEGEMTSYRSALVNANTLSEVAEEIGMNDYLLLSRGEAKDTGRARQYILANTYEALIGAIYIDRGYEAAETFIGGTLYGRVDKVAKDGGWMDAKSKFQEKAQEISGFTPMYKTVREEGPDHDKMFTVAVFVGNEEVAEGNGRSKQDAEQAAAAAALHKKKWL
ncbi:MAG: ribonuclease III [Candidatus Taylorbacteria bacterium RIFCSPLOWO2_12_FULL_47_20]|uniref:Ribonuclease 3 n=2 Tax=Candidatus Tayloriibacteriota TaxID=1817919 RepID=A0A1G2P9E8_9BACT|nr:MAG: ribonuclease III [Candidatus Taylorbacteria bacterium RIFCSPLOWO2_02_FULL_46_40]OHA44221.1 MAG: ribonuclease III [Candidatus Taylorbacteria bacterium RIFCSPLOWO2_12_FULL_47_20]